MAEENNQPETKNEITTVITKIDRILPEDLDKLRNFRKVNGYPQLSIFDTSDRLFMFMMNNKIVGSIMMAPHSPSLCFKHEGKDQVVPYIYDLTYDHRVKKIDLPKHILEQMKEHIRNITEYHIDQKVINAESDPKDPFCKLLEENGFRYLTTRTSNKTGKQKKCYTWECEKRAKKEFLLFPVS